MLHQGSKHLVAPYHINRGIKKTVSYPPFLGDVHELATKCDVLVICCSLTERTRHIIHKKILLALGRRGVVINISRRPIINEMELVKCFAGAGLDAFDNEPNVSKELLSMDNVVLTRHVWLLY